MDLKAYKFCDDDTNLTKKNKDDAGLDIKANAQFLIPSKSSVSVSTGLRVRIPNGCVGLVWSRSGLSFNKDIEVGAGCIDSTYRGELKVKLYNFGKTAYIVEAGDKIAQLLTIPIFLGCYEKIDEFAWNSIANTDRGDKGFGSTGK